MKMITVLLYILITILSPSLSYPQQRIVAADIVEGQSTEKNYLGAKSHFEKNASGVNAYADAAAAYIVDATGGSPNTTCTRSSSAPLSGDGSLLITKAGTANRQGEGCSINFSIDTKDKGKMVKVVLDYAVVSGTFVDGDVRVQILDVTNSRYIEPAPTNLLNHSLTSETYQTEFQASSDSTSYRIAFHIATVSTANYVLKLDDIKVGRINAPRGPPVTDETSWTPTLTNAGNATVTATRSRIGENIRLLYTITIGSSLPTGSIAFSKPTDVAFAFTTNQIIADSTVKGTVGASGATYHGVIRWDNTNSRMDILGGNGQQFWNATVPFTWAAGDTIVVSVQTKVTGWSSSTIMSSDASTSVVAASYNTTAGSTFNGSYTENIVKYTVKAYDTHSAYDTATGLYTVKVPGKYRVNGAFNMSGNTGADTYINVRKNSSTVRTVAFPFAANTAIGYSLHISHDLDLVAGDTVAITESHGSGVTQTIATSAAQSVFTIAMIQGPAQIAASESVAWNGYTTSTQTMTSSFVQVTSWTTVADSHGAFSGSTYTVPVSGRYSITGQLQYNAVAGSIMVLPAVYKNGSALAYGGRTVTSTTFPVAPTFSNTYRFLAGDTITIYGYASSNLALAGGSATNDQHWSITRT